MVNMSIWMKSKSQTSINLLGSFLYKIPCLHADVLYLLNGQTISLLMTQYLQQILKHKLLLKSLGRNDDIQFSGDFFLPVLPHKQVFLLQQPVSGSTSLVPSLAHTHILHRGSTTDGTGRRRQSYLAVDSLQAIPKVCKQQQLLEYRPW